MCGHNVLKECDLSLFIEGDLCAFNGVCVSKYEKLGQQWQFAGHGAMTEAEIQPIRECAEAKVPMEKVLISGMIRQVSGS